MKTWMPGPNMNANNPDVTMHNEFPPFSLSRLLKTVFSPEPGQRICILIDLPDPRELKGWAFLERPELTIQRHAHDHFYESLHGGVMEELKLQGGEIFAYEITGGSNLDLPDQAVALDGREVSLESEVYPRYDIILCISTHSATAPLTAFAKRFGFRGATLHGVNDIILRTGLAVDYQSVSRQAEKYRQAMTRADFVEIDFDHRGQTYTLKLELGGQEAQKSHGLCPPGKPDVANLPAGEVYFVPKGAEGRFPLQYEDGTIGLMEVAGGCIRKATLIVGNDSTIEAHNHKLADDPATGVLGELGLGTQELPVSGRDIQDEKVLGTVHVATGRSDHLGGDLTPDRFVKKLNATHDDILFSPTKTPEIRVREVRMHKEGATKVVLENYRPSVWLQEVLAA